MMHEIPLPRVELSAADRRLAESALEEKHRAAIERLLDSHPVLRSDLAFVQALSDEGLGILAIPEELAPIAEEISYVLALRERITELRFTR